MKYVLALLLFLCSISLYCQVRKPGIFGRYCYVDTFKYVTTLTLDTSNYFTFIHDGNDCTSDYMIYGQGKFENHKNHITLFFDSIPNLNQQKSAIAGDAVKSCKYITNEKIVITVLSNGSLDLDGRVILKKDQ